jgi:hypothetical protein
VTVLSVIILLTILGNASVVLSILIRRAKVRNVRISGRNEPFRVLSNETSPSSPTYLFCMYGLCGSSFAKKLLNLDFRHQFFKGKNA